MTFVAQELVGLEEEGLDLWIATWGQPDKIRHSIHERLNAFVHRLPKGGPGIKRLVRAWLKVRHSDGYAEARSLFWSEFRKDPTKRKVRAFARGVIIAAELPSDIRAIYAHFIGSTTTVARYASIRLPLGLPAGAPGASGGAASVASAPARSGYVRSILAGAPTVPALPKP